MIDTSDPFKLDSKSDSNKACFASAIQKWLAMSLKVLKSDKQHNHEQNCLIPIRGQNLNNNIK